MKKTLSLIMILVPFIGFAYSNSDVSNAIFLAQKGLVNLQSTEAGYRLDDKITRAEAIGIALKTKGIILPEDYKCKKYFPDAAKNDWVCRAIELASDEELISRANQKARPQDYITRAEAFSILFKASELGLDRENNIFTSKDTDAAQWQKDIFAKIRNAGVEVPGTQYPDANDSEIPYKFFPNRFATRAEVFSFVRNALEKKLTVDENSLQKKIVSIRVIDGDTIEYGGVTIRMIGLDAPESNTARYGYVECFGPEASSHLKELLKDAKELTIEKDPTQGETDKYGRTLGYIFYNGININTRMIADGYAFEYTYNTAYKYQSDNKKAEQLAKSTQLGLWSPNTCSGDRKKGTKDGAETTNNTSAGSYTCGSKKYCSEMTTCEEAKYYLNFCSLTRLDGDHDGTPCESICN